METENSTIDVNLRQAQALTLGRYRYPGLSAMAVIYHSYSKRNKNSGSITIALIGLSSLVCMKYTLFGSYALVILPIPAMDAQIGGSANHNIVNIV